MELPGGIAGRLPDFLIIGAQRGGTTSLYSWLSQHPAVAPAAQKEIHFFDLHHHRGAGWYRSRFPARRGAATGRSVTGEATPYYLFHPHAARRAAELVPEARLIALLRDPVERAFSHYKLGRAMGWETLSFEEAIAREPERMAGELERLLADETYQSFAHQHFTYLARGRYAEHLPAWLDRFPREHLLILRSEELYRDPPPVFRRVLEFLELDAATPAAFQRLNVSDLVEMDPDLRKRLREHFDPYNRRLEDLLGEDLGWEKA